MFWECHVVASSIERLLDQPLDQVHLQDFLDENDLIQECLNQNQRLLDYLIQPEIMKQLIRHVITVPDNGQFRNAHVVSELLSGDFQRIQETLLNNDHLDLFYSFLSENSTDSSATLNPILASYFARIIGTLIIRKPIEILNYFQAREKFKNDFISHLDSTSIADILFRFVVDSADQRSSVIQWYQSIHLMDDLMQEFRRTNSTSVQMNIANLFSEFLRLAFEQQTTSDIELSASGIAATIERFDYGQTELRQELYQSNRYSSEHNEHDTLKDEQTDGNFTPLVLAEHILSKSNFEDFFDALIQKPTLMVNGCDFLDTVLDLLSRNLPAPLCVSLASLSGEHSNETINTDEQMEINDEATTSTETKMNKTMGDTLSKFVKDPLMRIYLNLLEIIPSRLPNLIALLYSPTNPPKSLNTNSPTYQRQFIERPLGSSRLNLIKFFSKLIQTISNDYTGDRIYQIFNTNRLFQILIELFHHYIFNNFLHTQIYAILRLIIHINATAVNQPNDIWTRTALSENLDTSTFHYTKRCSYKLFQLILDPSDVNLFERLFDQYEHKTSEGISSDSNVSRFQSPNSGHVGQILRCLRDYGSNFNNYISFFKSNQSNDLDDENISLNKRWLKILDELNEEEKKWSAMHLHERHNTDSFRLNSSANSLGQHSNLNDSAEAVRRRQTFHTRSFGSSVAPCIDDDDDDEAETLNIDDELMNSEQNTNERKVADMKKIAFEPQFPPVFDEQNLWYQQNKVDSNNDQQEMKMKSAPVLPDLSDVHRKQQEKTVSSTESTFEQLCSLRSGDHPSGSILYPLQSSASSIRDEAILTDDDFWQKNPIYFTRKHRTKSSVKSNSSSSDEDSDDEPFFIETTDDNMEYTQSNNMMDIFRRQQTPIPDKIQTNPTDAMNFFQRRSSPVVVSSTPEHSSNDDPDIQAVLASMIHDDQTTEDVNDDDDDDLSLQNNFSFLIAKGLIKPKSF